MCACVHTCASQNGVVVVVVESYLLRDASRCDDAGCRNELNACMDPKVLKPIRRYRRARDVTSYGTPMWCHLRRAERRIRTTLSTRRTAGSLYRGRESTTNINARHASIVVARSRASPRVARRSSVRISRCTQRSVERKPPHGRRAVESTSDDEMKSLQIVISRHGPCGCARRRRRRASSCADDENGDGSTDAERRVSPTNQSLRRDGS